MQVFIQLYPHKSTVNFFFCNLQVFSLKSFKYYSALLFSYIILKTVAAKKVGTEKKA